MGDWRVVEELQVPKPTMEDVILEPRLELGGRTAEERVAGLISLGRPIVQPLESDVVEDRQLKQFMEGIGASNRFAAVHIVISFHGEGRSLEGVVVALSLSHEGAPEIPAPIAWSLSPLKVAKATSIVGRIGLTAKLGIVSYEMSRASESSVDEPFLIAVGERESDPEWHFVGSKRNPIAGVHTLSAIIQASAKIRVHAGLLVAATIRSRFGLVRYRAQLRHNHSQLEF
ncbi:hypothetical protein [Streptomyces nigrescens]